LTLPCEETLVDPRIAAALEHLKPALLAHPLDRAVEALTLYISGASVDAVFRSTGIARCRIEKWVKIAEVSRSREDVKAIQRSALDRVRHLAVAAQSRCQS